MKTKDQSKDIDSFIDSINWENVPNADDLLQHAKLNFEHGMAAVGQLEKKADDLVRYLGLGTGFLGLLLSLSLSEFHSIGIISISLGFVMWVLSLIFALSVRKSASYQYPAPTDFAILFMDKYSSQPSALKAWTALAFHKSMLSHIKIGYGKSRRLNWSYRFLVSALVFFFCSFVSRVLFSPAS